MKIGTASQGLGARTMTTTNPPVIMPVVTSRAQDEGQPGRGAVRDDMRDDQPAER